MWLNLFICLLLAHLVADYVLQTDKVCLHKFDKKWCSIYHYMHALIVFGLSWLAAFNIDFWWCAMIICVTHFGIDLWKSYCKNNVAWFVIDQISHILVLIGVAWLWGETHCWQVPLGISMHWIVTAAAVIVCWKPANIFIKLLLKYYSVNLPDNNTNEFNAGALTGTLERWLILIFICLQQYEALGFLIAAKSIIRFRETETAKTEYVLVGTLLSIFIAVVAGLILKTIDY